MAQSWGICIGDNLPLLQFPGITPPRHMQTDTTLETAEAAFAPESAPSPTVPAYMHEVYDWAYVSPRWVERLDNNLVVKLLLFGNDRRLMRAYLARIKPGMRVWQVAHVYGDLVSQAAARCGTQGRFLLTDITPIQIEHGARKLKGVPQAGIVRADAAQFSSGERFDLICSFFLLHEVPDAWKRQVVDNMLRQLPEGATALFVDYHRPAWWQPVRYILQAVNRLLEPFAASLWRREIASFATHPEHYAWTKSTLFGGVYQIVTATRLAQ